ncbi:DUF1566 domain-containing protein [Desulfobotulus sp. H1]|uniref:DUF1566 domain-containing protein n=1 Tax=Desulfobotulus pelophilus TaxID=2823377 RepID=A0ABT3NDB9_9BACT|nr:DUF1566 domain-containing protein [Desulfobotulus pelophilus]MCW7755456.1 DUF1566 domain-containing protein [Desulfobotulus pelophilus]
MRVWICICIFFICGCDRVEKIYIKQEPKKYQINSDGTVIDLNTGLEWMRCSIGQIWDGETCAGEAEKINWYAAMSMAEKKGWRLPSIEELSSLVYCSSGIRMAFVDDKFYARELEAGLSEGGCIGESHFSVIDRDVFPKTPVDLGSDGYWSSTTDFNDETAAWIISFYNGGVFRITKEINFENVRLVRSMD